MDVVVSAVRGLIRQARSTTVAVIILAVGIAANATVFSVWHAVMWRPLPYRDADRLVLAWSRRSDAFVERREYRSWDFEVPSQFAESRVFAAVAIGVGGGMALGGGTADRVRAAAVSTDFFSVIGANALVGRLFGAADILQTQQVAVISEGFWHRRFGGGPQALGAPLMLNGRSFVVLGVVPRRVQLPNAPDIWIPSGVDQQLGGEYAEYVVVLRLRNRVTLNDARAEAARIATERYPLVTPEEGRFVRLVPLRDGLTESVRPVLVLVALCAGIVLLVSCLNVVGLLSIRLSTREQEFAVRAALGASRWRIAGYILVEGLLLAGAGAVVGVPAAIALAAAASRTLPAGPHGGADVALDVGLFGATALLAVLTAALVGIVPAVSMSRGLDAGALRGGGTAHAALARSRLRRWLVALQIAAAVALLAAATAVIRKVAEVMADDLGVRGENTLVFRIELPQVTYRRLDAVHRFYRQIEDEFRRVPGVRSVGATTALPGAGERRTRGQWLHLEGMPRTNTWAYDVAATPEYFNAMGIEVVTGRLFGPHDRFDAPRVVVASVGVARAFGLAPRDLVGRRIDLTPAMPFTTWAEIVGVVRDVSLRGAESPATPGFYVPFDQRPLLFSTYTVVRGQTDPRLLIPALRAAARRVDPDIPLYDIRTFDQVRASSLADRRLIMMLMLGLGAIALCQAAIGLYGVTRHAVEGRMRELGIRVALGASPARIRAETILDGGTVVVAGVSLGAGAAFGLWRVVSARIANAGVLDPYGMGAVGAGAALVAMAAAWPAVSRATRVDPAAVLRRD